jgi:hypothetical protein
MPLAVDVQCSFIQNITLKILLLTLYDFDLLNIAINKDFTSGQQGQAWTMLKM